MFLNIPPNDYNLEETLNSLYYGTRVKCITNECFKNTENKEVTKLKENIRGLIEENEVLKKALKKNSFSQKDNLKNLLSNSSLFESLHQNEDLQSVFEKKTGKDMQNYNSVN